MYQVLNASFVSHLSDGILPFGLIADKMTARHRKRHIMGIRIPIWDMNNPKINNDIYVRHSAVGVGTGENIKYHLLDSLVSFGFTLQYIRRHMCGMAMDGQYTGLNIEDHISQTLGRDINLSWDPMHRIELAHKHFHNEQFIENTIAIIHEAMTTFKTGNNFELLLSQKDLVDNFYQPKIFKDMKFVAYSREVFKTFIGDFKA